MAKGISDISNTAVRIFLQEMGKAYDIERGLKPYSKKDFPIAKEFFDNVCCFCGISGTRKRLTGDHLVPMNKTALGLEAWGNIVPACTDCNEQKHKKDWVAFLKQIAGDEFDNRRKRIDDFRGKYGYSPKLESIALAVEELYEESGAIAMQLIQIKVKRALKQPT